MNSLETSIRDYPTYKLEEVVSSRRKNYSDEAIEFAEDELTLRKLKSLNPIEQIDFISSVIDERLKFIINHSRSNYPQALYNLVENEYAKRGFERLEWHYLDNNKPIGPVKLSDLKKLAGHGALFQYSLVFREGLQNWIPASSVPGLFDQSNTNIPPPPIYPNIPASENIEKSEEVVSQELGCGLSIICVLFPIIGVILFFTEKNEKGRNALALAFVGFILGIISYFMFYDTGF